MPSLPREACLVLLAATPGATCDETMFTRLTMDPFDWDAVGRLAEREKLVPVVWRCIRDHASQMPAKTAAAFQQESARTELRMVATEAALRRVLLLLHTNGVQVVLLKGAALALTAYGSFVNRPMGDLDILVAPADADRAWQLIRDAGWSEEYEDGIGFYESFHHLVALVDPSPFKIVLEIHRSMLPFEGPFAFDEAAVWNDACAVQVGQSQAWVPSTTHQLLHHSIHFAWSHMFTALARTVRDVTSIIRREPPDWVKFTELALQARAGTCAYWTLAITRTITGVPVPDETLESLRPNQPRSVSRVLERAYIAMGLLRACPSIGVAQLLWEVGIQPGRSSLGAVRPWHAGELFKEGILREAHQGWSGRIVAQARNGADWLGFARLLRSPVFIR